MESTTNAAPRRSTAATWVLVCLVLVPGLIVAGLVGYGALVARALQVQVVELRAQLASPADLAGRVRMLRARKDLLTAEIQIISTLKKTPDPTPEWERVLAAVPPEAMTGRVRFCSGGGGVAIHGKRADEAYLARVATALQADVSVQSAKVTGQGSDDVVLTVVPKPQPPSEEWPR